MCELTAHPSLCNVRRPGIYLLLCGLRFVHSLSLIDSWTINAKEPLTKRISCMKKWKHFRGRSAAGGLAPQKVGARFKFAMASARTRGGNHYHAASSKQQIRHLYHLAKMTLMYARAYLLSKHPAKFQVNIDRLEQRCWQSSKYMPEQE